MSNHEEEFSIKKLKEERKELLLENDKLEGILDTSVSQLREYKVENQQLSDEFSSVSQNLSEAQKRIKKLEKSNKELRENKFEWREKNEELSGRIMFLSEKLDKIRNVKKENNQVESKYRVMQRKNSVLENKILEMKENVEFHKNKASKLELEFRIKLKREKETHVEKIEKIEENTKDKTFEKEVKNIKSKAIDLRGDLEALNIFSVASFNGIFHDMMNIQRVLEQKPVIEKAKMKKKKKKKIIVKKERVFPFLKRVYDKPKEIKQDEIRKIVILGKKEVGKTNLLKILSNQKGDEEIKSFNFGGEYFFKYHNPTQNKSTYLRINELKPMLHIPQIHSPPKNTKTINNSSSCPNKKGKNKFFLSISSRINEEFENTNNDNTLEEYLYFCDFMENTDAITIVVDITSAKALRNARKWINVAINALTKSKAEKEINVSKFVDQELLSTKLSPPIIVIGNKKRATDKQYPSKKKIIDFCMEFMNLGFLVYFVSLSQHDPKSENVVKDVFLQYVNRL